MDPLKPSTTPAPSTLWAWLISILSEDTGHGSWTRVQGALTWAACVALAAFSVATGHDIPPGAQIVLLTLLTGSGVSYAVNRGGEVYESLRSGSSSKEAP